MTEKRFYPADIDLSRYRFLVTGGAGFIGSHIVDYLLLHGAAEVRVLDNFATGSLQNIAHHRQSARFTLVEGDIRDADTCLQACAGIDYLSHQAALGSVPRSIQDPISTNAVNVGGFVNMLFAAQKQGVKRVVYASSSSVYGDEPNLPKIESRMGRALSPYAVSKLTNEHYAAVFAPTYGMELAGLRYFNVFGPRQSPKGAYAAVIPLFIEQLRQGKAPFINGDGTQSRDFTYIENAVQANIRALFATHPQAATAQTYNIAFGERYTVNALYDALARRLQCSHIAPQYREARAGDVAHSLADISKARTLLGYQPEIDFETGLSLTVDATLALLCS
jgi:UDP-N-acetylglucosamine 4-epimerase